MASTVASRAWLLTRVYAALARQSTGALFSAAIGQCD
jgi:hypothetical protein